MLFFLLGNELWGGLFVGGGGVVGFLLLGSGGGGGGGGKSLEFFILWGCIVIWFLGWGVSGNGGDLLFGDRFFFILGRGGGGGGGGGGGDGVCRGVEEFFFVGKLLLWVKEFDVLVLFDYFFDFFFLLVFLIDLDGWMELLCFSLCDNGDVGVD